MEKQEKPKLQTPTQFTADEHVTEAYTVLHPLRELATLVGGGGAWYQSGFAPDREARSQPWVTVAGGSHWVWEGTAEPVHTSAESATSFARSLYLVY